VIVMVGAGRLAYDRQVRQAEGMRVKEELLAALRVTSEKLLSAQAQIQQLDERRRLELPE
jgi:hypothetical protein